MPTDIKNYGCFDMQQSLWLWLWPQILRISFVLICNYYCGYDYAPRYQELWLFWYATMIVAMIMPSNIKNGGCFDMQLCCCDLISHNMVHSPLYSALFVFLVPASLSPNKVQSLTRYNAHNYQVGIFCICNGELLNKY